MLYSPAFTPLFHGAASALDEILLFYMPLAVILIVNHRVKWVSAFFVGARLGAPAETPSSLIPLPTPGEGTLGLHCSRRVVLTLSALFSLDAFAGGFVVSSFVAYWFNVRFGVEPGALGAIFFSANILAGISALLAARVAGVARTTGAAISPSITGVLLSYPALLNVPFYLAGGLKIVYDVLLYRSFRTLKPPEEKAGGG